MVRPLVSRLPVVVLGLAGEDYLFKEAVRVHLLGLSEGKLWWFGARCAIVITI